MGIIKLQTSKEFELLEQINTVQEKNRLLEAELKGLVRQKVDYSRMVDQLLEQLEEKNDLIRHLERMLKNDNA